MAQQATNETMLITAEIEDRLRALRTDYRERMNRATDQAQRFAANNQMDRVSEFSSEAARMQEAFTALNACFRICGLDASPSPPDTAVSP